MLSVENKENKEENKEIPKTEQATFDVMNPANREKLATLPIKSPADVAEAVRKARLAQAEWANLPFQQRAKYLKKLRRVMLEHKEEFINVMVKENGKPRAEALLEIFYISDIITYYTKNGEKWLADEKVGLHLLKTKRALIAYHPVGVVGVISPWNFPLILSFGDIIPALLAGNAVVLKPSEVTPLTTLAMEKYCHEADFPANVLQVVTGLGETGGALIDAADLIAFTGSVATGKKVMERAAKTLTPVLLELGGKDPMIVLKDANMERAVNGAVYGGFFNAGQVCISTERVYVEAPIYDEFVAKVVEGVKKLRVGIDANNNENIDMGALTFARQLEIVEQQVNDAVSKGAKVVTGGKRRDDLPGLFYEPTILTDVTDDMLIMQEETFGPVLPIIKVADAEEAIRKANDSRFGLASSIWTKNTEKGETLARRIEAGSTCVNDTIVNYMVPEVPFGGIKESGIGFRHGGAASIRKYCRTHSIVIDRFQLKREFTWFPYNKGVSKLVARFLDLLYKRG